MTKAAMFKSICVLVVICIVISGALAIVNSFTAPVIEKARIERENASRLKLLPGVTGFRKIALDGMPESITSAYSGQDAYGNIQGYVFSAGRKGFDGTIVVMAAFGLDGRIINVATMDVTSETKTLGGLTASPNYTNQYIGKDAALEGVDGISGATITSSAYEACVLDCFTAFELVKEADQ